MAKARDSGQGLADEVAEGGLKPGGETVDRIMVGYGPTPYVPTPHRERPDMPYPDTDEPSSGPLDDTELAQALIDRKEQGDNVDTDILALLDDMERVGSVGSDAYVMLDAYRPGSEGGAAPVEIPSATGV